MKKRKIEIFLYDILYEDRTNEIASFTTMELAAFKRTNRFKRVLTMKKLCTVAVEIKFPYLKIKL